MTYDILTGENTETLVQKMVMSLRQAQDEPKLVFRVTAQWYSAPGGRVDVYVALQPEHNILITANTINDLVLKAAELAKKTFQSYAVFEFPHDRAMDNGAVINIRMNRALDRAWAGAEARLNQIRGPGQ